jgi:hypothetical protein
LELLRNIPDKEREQQDFRIPVIIPIVLYNGKEPRTASRNFADLYENGCLFKYYALQFRYYLRGVNRYDPQRLLDIGNLLAAVLNWRSDSGSKWKK